MDFSVTDLIPLALLIVIVVIAVQGVKTVPQGFNFIIERLGKYHQTLKPGLAFIIPFVDQVRAKVSMMETVLDVPSQEVITKDNARITTDGVVFYQILNAPKSTYEVANLVRALLNLSMTNIRTVMGSMDLDDLLSKRDEINNTLLRAVDEATSPWGVKVTRIEVLDIEPPVDLTNAMARQLKAERERRAVILEAEGDRQSTVLRAQGQLEAAKLEAQARERLAEAEANATRMVSEAVAAGDIQALNYFVAQKYTEALQALATAPNQKVFMLPVEASGLIGSIAGIGELFKHLGDDDDDGGGGGQQRRRRNRSPSGGLGGNGGESVSARRSSGVDLAPSVPSSIGEAMQMGTGGTFGDMRAGANTTGPWGTRRDDA